MAKTIFEELGGKYERQGEYFIPCIALPTEEEQPIGTWGGVSERQWRSSCEPTEPTGEKATSELSEAVP